MAEKLIRSHPNSTVQLSISAKKIMQTWHKTISGRTHPNSSLCTGLVVAETSEFRGTLNPVLGLPIQQQSLQVQPGNINILHYPASAKHPVLPAMNLSGEIS